MAEARESDRGSLTLVRPGSDRSFLIVVRLCDSGPVDVPVLTESAWHIALDTETRPFADDPVPPRIDPATGTVHFRRPGAVVLQSTTA
jgi:hypothetical protein